MVGRKFGDWLVVQRADTRGSDIRYLCLCDCGLEGVFYKRHLRSGKVRSCECNKVTMEQGVPIGVWRNARKFKCVKCLKWCPLYYESRSEGVCSSCG
jgi:hypothetical protein